MKYFDNYMRGDEVPGGWKGFHEDVKQAFEDFWLKNKLSYKDGELVRTDVPRKRPNYHYELDFRKKGKKDGDYQGTNS